MRRAISGLLLSGLLVGCGGDWTDEQKLTKQVLVDAQLARSAVVYQVARYEEVLRAAATAADPGAQAGKNLAEYLGSTEGKVVEKLLTARLKPVPADPKFARAKEIDEVTAATAELAARALQPRGAWDAWTRQVDGAKSRLDRAIAALETGTKGYVMIDVRQETNLRTAEFTASLGKARSAAGGEPAPAPSK